MAQLKSGNAILTAFAVCLLHTYLLSTTPINPVKKKARPSGTVTAASAVVLVVYDLFTILDSDKNLVKSEGMLSMSVHRYPRD